MQIGHYTAFVRTDETTEIANWRKFYEDSDDKPRVWTCFDDSRVMPISENQIVSQKAYILFYRRRHTH